MVFESELEFESAVIRRLVGAGWINHATGQPEILRYKTEMDLIQNWADILFENNNSIDRLNDAPLTDGEMMQLLEQIKTLRTPVKLNEFINGKTVTVRRDNPSDPSHFGHDISLKIYDRQEIAGGQSRYQIVEQPVFAAKNPMLSDRRGDFMLLINGMPVIHVELKKSGIPVSQACYQIEKYAHEGVFTGLFSLVQLFVAMTPDETMYFANPGPEGKFNPDFYFHWADFNNEPMNNWEKVVTNLLSIPMAHTLIGFYTVADNTDNILKVMRSYQYFAASGISQAVAKRRWDEPKQRGGYVWHTTGSGKTMTSFKSAQLISDSGDADKVVFLMDRIELGTQSLQVYRGYASAADSVQSTENTNVLITKLRSDNPANALIVTSIQKMSRIMEEGGYNAKDIEKIRRKRIVFIIDECHRDTFGEMIRNIKTTFPNAMFFGFSGTPIHEENQKKLNTTADVFGNEIHRYSIADGIRDKNVLGFDPTMVMTYKDTDVREAVALDKARANDISEVFSDESKKKVYYAYMDPARVPMAGYENEEGKYVKGIEDELTPAQYTRREHWEAVFEDIRSNWIRLSQNSKFHAILATSSIPEAIQYYRHFRDNAPEMKVFPLFDPSIDNNPGGIVKEDALVEILTDYNAEYGVNYTIPTYADYKKDISLRLAHKAPYTNIDIDRSKRVDLLIVVDQMLTGFDSRWLNTLYLDKVLTYENLIQAFSRTNRLFDPAEKPFGIIRYYRKPHTMSRNVEEAFKLYSGNRPYGIFVSKLADNLKKMNKAYEDIASLFASSGIDDFTKLPRDTEARAKFARLFKDLNTFLESAKIQGFLWDKREYKNELPSGEEETITVLLDETKYLTLAQRYKELFGGGGGDGGSEDIPYEIDSHLTEINTENIDQKYMESRFRKYIKQLQEGVESTDALKELHKSFAVLSQEQQKYARIFLTDVQRGDIFVTDDKSLMDYIIQYQNEAQNTRIHRFAESIGVYEEMLRDFMSRNVNENNMNEFGLFDQLKDSVDRPTARAYFEKVEGGPVPPRKLPIKIDTYLRNFILSGGTVTGADHGEDVDEKL